MATNISELSSLLGTLKATMNLLIIGGTRFVGRHIAQIALAQGHNVTLFHRGQTNPDIFPEATILHGDRKMEEGLAVLKGKEWDAVIDVCGYEPRFTKMSAEILKNSVGLYCFISTISVYSGPFGVNGDENTALAQIENPDEATLTNETYGALKVCCEKTITDIFGDKALIVRPGLIVGPHDETDRFGYWPHRVAQGGTVIAPGTPDMPTQFVDVRDLALFTLQAVSAQLSGVYNVAGKHWTMGDVLSACETIAPAGTTVRWVPEEWLIAQEVQPWIQLPLWIASTDPDMLGFNRLSDGKAMAAGLTYRPLTETVKDTLAWDAARPLTENTWKNTLSREREAELLLRLG
jgi:2'-hydroxyisoflavone reductase